MGTFLKMKKDRILKDILKMKVKRECTRGRPRWEQPVRKMTCRRKEQGRSLGRQR
jgi:hypothetical protein